MANRYWVGGTASWDGTAGTKWALTSGGTGGQAIPTTSDDVFFDANSGAGTVTIASGNTGCANINFSGFTGTFAGSAVLTCAGSITLVAGMTMSYSGIVQMTKNSGTAIITSNGKSFGTLLFYGSATFQLADQLEITNSIYRESGTFDANGKTVLLSGIGTSHVLSGGLTLYNLTVGGSGGAQVRFSGGCTVSNILSVTQTGRVTFNANNNTNAQETLSVATNSLQYSNFQNINATGAASWDLSAITGLSGDLGGNSGITFTPSQINYWVGGTGSWTTVGEWANSSGGAGGSGRVPLPQDDATFDANSFSAGSQTVTANTSILGRNIDWTNATNSPTLLANVGCSIFGSLTLISAMTFTAASFYYFEGRGTHTITMAGKTWTGYLSISSPGGTYTLQDDLSTTQTISLRHGTFNANNHNVTAASFTTVYDCSVFMGSGLWTISGSGTVWNTVGSATAIIPGTSTIKLTDSTSTGKTLTFGVSKTFNNLWISGSGTGTYSLNCVTGVTFNNITIDTPPHTVLFEPSRTYTVNSLTSVGSSGNLITLKSISNGTPWTISKSNGIINCEYVSLQDSSATGGAQFFAGTNSSSVSGNSGWIFGASGIATEDIIAVTENNEIGGLETLGIFSFDEIAIFDRPAVNTVMVELDDTVSIAEEVWLSIQLAIDVFEEVVFDDSIFAGDYEEFENPEIILFPQQNDLFSHAELIDVSSGGTVLGHNFGATQEDGELLTQWAYPYNTSVWWRFVAPKNGTIEFNTNGSTFDTTLSVYNGLELSNLSLIVEDDDSGEGSRSSVLFPVTGGETYYVMVAGYGSEEGLVVLSWEFITEIQVADMMEVSDSSVYFETITGIQIEDTLDPVDAINATHVVTISLSETLETEDSTSTSSIRYSSDSGTAISGSIGGVNRNGSLSRQPVVSSGSISVIE